MPRIILGSKKGSKIAKPTHSHFTRPILARVKNSLFSSIKDRIPGAYFLDLFAGSGSCGIEALSMGAKYALFVERDRNQANRIKEALKELGFENATRVFIGNSFLAIKRLKEGFDIIFLGPPYKDFLVNKTIDAIDKAFILKDDGLVIAQHHKKEDISKEVGQLILKKQKKFGETVLSFYEKTKVDNSL
ncbi:TPA: 16S rRNA (guanine(966)-N(2))-methyltransferase RsmD [bacterium]|nr:16S rRNA (guanine(966)-N(2))-methyltransferase RsmD [bacterium]